LFLLLAAPVFAGVYTPTYTGDWLTTGESLDWTTTSTPFGFVIRGYLGGTCAAYGTCSAEVFAERALSGGDVAPGMYQTQTYVQGSAQVGAGATLGPIEAETWLQYALITGFNNVVSPTLSYVLMPGGSGAFDFSGSDFSENFYYNGSLAWLEHRFAFQVDNPTDGAVDVTVVLSGPPPGSSDAFLQPSAIPEPGTVVTLLAGLAVLGLAHWRRKHA
jgi:hypothetical protein